ncbi:5-oxoprolinase subunit PxpB [Dokdonella sp.]|uniref:5-oxoprolinase subunit PxpB n=1 Tax=Dokdonella sp. TaxID=2291710 RepID=UPI003C461198
MSKPFTIEALGESALLLRLGDSLDEDTNSRVHALAEQVRRQAPPWLLEVVPAFSSLALCIDPLAFPIDMVPFDAVRKWLNETALDKVRTESVQATRWHEIPVRYGGEFGPDLQQVAAHCGIDSAEVVRRHTASTYRVGMLGFAAGFPYLLGMDLKLAMPRHATPRTRVAAGSVGIGGTQTGIYPRQGPGGWQIIGRTEFCLFDHEHDPPAAIGPGDCVRFVESGHETGRKQ